MRAKLTVSSLPLAAVVIMLFWPALVFALNEQHQCSYCHNVHSLIPPQELTENLCLSCHGPGGASLVKADVHTNSAGSGYPLFRISCLQCHNPHSNRINWLGGTNLKLVGTRQDSSGFAKIATPNSGVRDVVFESRGAILGPTLHSFADADEDGNLVYDGICETCHTQTTFHRNDGSAGTSHSTGKTCVGCHAHDKGFAVTGCTACHNGTGGGALNVSDTSPHSTNATGYTCIECHTGHGAGTVEIPNNPLVGINYSSNDETGIALGGSATTGTTEAEICWNCHGTAHSEWGTNAGGTYDYGSVSTSNWLTAYWSSAKFSYKNGSLANPPGGQARASFHDTGNSWPGTSSESVADIRCSYCHDVHDTMGPTGRPYLRGSWRANPYAEDGAPRAGDIYTAGGNPYGAVPRGNLTSAGPGGFRIDQNSGNPNSSIGTTLAAYTATDGLCALCHDAATLVAQSPLHKNPVKYFGADYNDSGAARNVFRKSDRSATPTRFNPGMAYQGTDLSTAGNYISRTPSTSWMGGLRNKDFDASIAVPPTIGGRYGYLSSTFQWGVTIDDTTVDVDYHNFTCSKCHTPHASRLPRLMITNCLDTNLNTWDDQYQNDSKWSNWPNVTPGNNKQLSQAHTAQNCHRYTGEASGPGWNTVTPW